jgi:signal peptidase I
MLVSAMNSPMNLPPQTQQGPGRTIGIVLAIVVGACLVAALVFVPSSLRKFGEMRFFRNVGDSMDPAIYSGDKVTVDTAFYSQHPIADGDIIVFHRNGSVVVKRVSAISGETIEGKNGKLIRNGASLAEPYLHEPDDLSNTPEATFPARTIPAGQVFVTGDWRSRSLDSRDQDYGPVHTTDIVGKVVYVYASSHPGQQGRKF